MKTWRDIEELTDRKTLLQLVEEEGTPTRIGRRLGCSKESVRHAMKHHGIVSRQYLAGDDIKNRLRL